MRYFIWKNAFSLSSVFVKLTSGSLGKFETPKTHEKCLGGREWKDKREGKQGGAIGLQLLFFLSVIRGKTKPPGLGPLLQATSDNVFTSPPSVSSQEEPIGKDFENTP